MVHSIPRSAALKAEKLAEATRLVRPTAHKRRLLAIAIDARANCASSLLAIAVCL